jgi:subtilisin family serine protease
MLTTVALSIICSPLSPWATAATRPVRGFAPASDFVPGEVLVKFKRGLGLTAKASALKVAGAFASERIGSSADTLLLRLSPGSSVENAIASLRSQGKIVFAEPNYVGHLLYTPSDPDFPNQWGLENTGQTIGGVNGTPGADIDASSAWELEKGFTSPVTVAVIDSGLDIDRPDLDMTVWSNNGEQAGNGIDDDGNGYVDDSWGYNWCGISQTNCTYDSSGVPQQMYKECGSSASTQAFAQSVVGTGCALTHVGVMLSKQNNPTGSLKISIRSGLAGADMASFSISPTEVLETPTEIYKQLSSPCQLDSGNTYYIIVETSCSDPSNCYLLYDYDSAKTGWFAYWDGSEYAWDGASWNCNDGCDLYFRTNPNASPLDDNNHGTQVSGIIAAHHDAEGIAGLSPGSRIMPLKVSDSNSRFTSSNLCCAIRYAADNGAKVINLSLGHTTPSLAEQDAIDYAYGKGVIMFAAAGNDSNTTVWYPAGYTHVIGVGATTNQDLKAGFSNYNSSVDITAPGHYIRTSIGTYAVGTSLASPHAAGLAALIRSINPRLSPARIEEDIETSAEDLGPKGRDDSYGYGRINARRAIEAAMTPRVNSYFPAYGPARSQVTLTGDGFGASQGGSYVSFGNSRPQIVSWSEGSITFVVPDGFSGPTDVTVTCFGYTSSPSSFTVTPRIDTLSPAYGPARSQVTLTGDGFGASQGGSYVSFGSLKAMTEHWTNNRITCITPDGITGTMPVVVVTPYGKSSSRSFNATTPTWYLAEGTSAWGFTTYISIENPNDTTCTASITYDLGGGETKKNDVKLPPMSQTTVNPEQVVHDSDFSTVITCKENKNIAVDRTMIWTGPGAPSPEAHSSTGATCASKDWYFAEGSTAWGFESWLLVQNPSPVKATCAVTYMLENGAPVTVKKSVPANSRRSFMMSDDIESSDASVHVASDVPVVAERSMYRNKFREGHCTMGEPRPSTDSYLAEGSTAWGYTSYVLIANANTQNAGVTVTLMTPDGPHALPTFRMPPSSRKTIRVNDVLPGSDFSVYVHSDKPLVAERAMYWEAGPLGEACHDSIGLSATHRIFYLPDGQTSNGRETWVLVQNPNDNNVQVKISYLTPNGMNNVVKTETIAAYSRRTFSMLDHSGIVGRAAIMVQSLHGEGILVERSMYWNHRGAGTDTVGGCGD